MKKVNVISAFVFALINVGAVYTPLAVGATDNTLRIGADIKVYTCTLSADSANSLTRELGQIYISDLRKANNLKSMLKLNNSGGVKTAVNFSCPGKKSRILFRVMPVNTAPCKTVVGTNLVCSTGENKTVALLMKYRYFATNVGGSGTSRVADNSSESKKFIGAAIRPGDDKSTFTLYIDAPEMTSLSGVPIELGRATFEYVIEVSEP